MNDPIMEIKKLLFMINLKKVAKYAAKRI